MVSVKAIYKNGRLIFCDSEEIPEDGTEVTVSFAKHPKTVAPSLRGSWAKYLPKDFDLDAELRKIRSEWEREMEELYG